MGLEEFELIGESPPMLTWSGSCDGWLPPTLPC